MPTEMTRLWRNSADMFSGGNGKTIQALWSAKILYALILRSCSFKSNPNLILNIHLHCFKSPRLMGFSWSVNKGSDATSNFWGALGSYPMPPGFC